MSNGATLKWDRNSEVDIAGYKVYYGTSSGLYDLIVDVGNVTEYELCYLREYLTYHLAVSAYNTSRIESVLSNDLAFYADDSINYYKDNCPYYYNPDQKDTFPPGGNNCGDACECESDLDASGAVDGVDTLKFKGDYGRNPYNNPCTNQNPCLGDLDCSGAVDAIDSLKFRKDYGRNPYNNPCPSCSRYICDYPD